MHSISLKSKENDKILTDIKIFSVLSIKNQNQIKYKIFFNIQGPMADKIKTFLLKKSKNELKNYIKQLTDNFLSNSIKSYSYNFSNLSFNKTSFQNLKLRVEGRINNLKWMDNHHILIKPPLINSYFLKKIDNIFSITEKILIKKESKKLKLETATLNSNINNNLYSFKLKTYKKSPISYIIENKIYKKGTKQIKQTAKKILRKTHSIRKDYMIFYYE